MGAGTDIHLTSLHSLGQLDWLSDSRPVNGSYAETIAHARDEVPYHELCVAYRLRLAWQPEGAVYLTHLHSVAQDGAATVMKRSEPGQGHGVSGLTNQLRILRRIRRP